MRMVTLLASLLLAGCAATSLRTINGGKAGYIVLKEGKSDKAIVYCTDPETGVVQCREVWRRK